MKECCDASLRRLRLERIDLYQLHAPDPAVPLAESLGALRELQDEVRHIGVSNVSADELEQAREVVDVATVQNRYNAADRNSRTCSTHASVRGSGSSLVSARPAGRLTRAARPGSNRVPAGRDARSGRDRMAAGALAGDAPIPGTSSPDHLEQNLAAADLRLGAEELDEIAAAA